MPRGCGYHCRAVFLLYLSMKSPYKDYPSIESASVQERIDSMRHEILILLKSSTITINEAEDIIPDCILEEQFEVVEAIKLAVIEFKK